MLPVAGIKYFWVKLYRRFMTNCLRALLRSVGYRYMLKKVDLFYNKLL